MNDLQILIVTLFLGGITYWCVRYLARIFSKASASTSATPLTSNNNGNAHQKKRKVTPEKTEHAENKEQAANESKAAVAGKKGGKQHGKDKQPAFVHPWLLTSLKGHSGRVLDINLSENGKYVASCADDRTVLIWFTKDFANKEHKCIRGNIPFDHADKIKWSPDSKAFIIHCATSNELQVHKLNKKPDDGSYSISQALVFNSAHTDTGDIIGMDLATNGKFIMTCSNKNDLVLYDIRGEVLTRIDTCQMTTYTARISPCGRFVATSGFTPDVKVWEVKFSRAGEFEKMTRAFELTGHTSGIYHFDFNASSSHAATLSKDGKFRVFSINIDYQIGQDPVQIVSGAVEISDIDSKISLSADGRIVAISHKSNVYFYSGLTGAKLSKIEAVHSDSITAMAFDAESKWLITSGDKHIRVFHNVPGFKLSISDLQEKLKVATTESMKERLHQQIKAAHEKIKKIEGQN